MNLREGTLLRYIIYIGFVCIIISVYGGSPGDDLSSTYFACKLLYKGQLDSVYDYNPTFFHVVDSFQWLSVAREESFSGFLHPYVQSPLWLFLLTPLCESFTFIQFKWLFLFLSICSICALYELIARYWARKFLNPLYTVVTLSLLGNTTPIIYSFWLVQNHSLFILATFAALISVSNRHVLLGAILLSFAALVKVTPGFIVLYWLVVGYYRAVIYFTLVFIVLTCATVLFCGVDLTMYYVETLKRISGILLLSFNNQSFVTLLVDVGHLSKEIFDWRILKLEPLYKYISIFMLMGFMLLSGYISKDRRFRDIGSVIAVIAITIFPAIAWSHYFFVLLVLVMILVQRLGSAAFVPVLIIYVLNIEPIAIEPLRIAVSEYSLLRSHLASAIAGLLFLLVFWGVMRFSTRFNFD